MRGRHLVIPVLALAALLLAGAVAADEIILVDGRKVVGEIIEERPDSVTVRVPYGTFKLPRSRILSITKQDKYKYHLIQGDHFAERGRLEVAIGEYRKALEIRPGDKIAKQKYHGAIAKQGRRLLRLRRHDDARKVFERLGKMDPGNLDARAGLAQLKRQLGEILGLIKRADGAAAAGRYGEAIGALDKAMTAAPERRVQIGDKLAMTYKRVAEQLYAAKRFDDAAAYYTRALVLKPDLAPEVEGRFISCVIPGVVAELRAGKTGSAARKLKALIGFAPTDPRVLYLAGTVYANQGKLDQAAQSLARGLGRSWSGRATREQVKELHGELQKVLGGSALKLNKPFQERFTESDAGDWQKLESGRFVVYHHNEGVAKLVLRSAEYYVDRTLSNLALPASVLWKQKCPIYIYRNKTEYRANSGQAEWSGGVSSVRSRGGRLVKQKIMTYQTAPKLLNSVLPHELAHLVFMSSVRYTQKWPLALHEGVAVYNELAFRRSYYRGVLRTHLRTETTYPTDKLLGMKKYPPKPDLFYAQGLSLVQYLISARDRATFNQFAQGVNQSGLLGGLEKYYGFKSYAELDRHWLEWAKK
jgi:tetratricopeptide (TPR) repeat protein